jgi:putative flippase GtrA
MLNLIRRLWAWRERRVVRQFIKFCVVGGINTVLDFGLYYLMTRHVAYFAGHYVLATSLSFGVAVISSFCLNTFWTFSAGGAGWHKRAPQFFAVALIGMGFNDLIMYMVVAAGGHDMVGKVSAVALVTAWNFLAHRYWTFKIRS